MKSKINMSESDSSTSTFVLAAAEPMLDMIKESGLNLSDECKYQLVEYLTLDMGASSIEDMRYVTDEDLSSFLLPIQRRKFLAFIQKKLNANPTELMPNFTTPVNLQSRQDRETLEVPYEFNEQHMPSSILTCFQEKTRLSPPDRRLFITLLTKDILLKFNSPRREHLKHVAGQIVAKFPKSLADTDLKNDLLGDGCGSLILQLENSISNQKRPDTKKRSLTFCSDALETENNKPKRKNYGTKEQLTGLITSNEVENYRLALLQKYQVNGNVPELDKETQEILSKSFPAIRQLIHSQTKQVSEIAKDWPILFTTKGFSSHYEQLTGNSVRTFLKHYSENLGKVLAYMQSLQTKKKSIKDIVRLIYESKKITNNDQPEVLGCMHLLGEYFGENFSKVVMKVQKCSN